MGILKIFDLLTKVGGVITIVGELLRRLGTGGTQVLDPPNPQAVRQDMSQESSYSQGAEDEKPETEDS